MLPGRWAELLEPDPDIPFVTYSSGHRHVIWELPGLLKGERCDVHAAVSWAPRPADGHPLTAGWTSDPQVKPRDLEVSEVTWQRPPRDHSEEGTCSAGVQRQYGGTAGRIGVEPDHDGPMVLMVLASSTRACAGS